jgi:hypothetical protein
MALSILASSAAAESSHRLVVVVGLPTDLRAAKQNAVLAHDDAALTERDVVVQSLTPEAARRNRPELGVQPGATFEVLLVGKDGGVKWRSETPIAVSEIAARIDAMPMRQEEIKRQ